MRRAFALHQLIGERRQANQLYLEFLRAPSLSAGLYELPGQGVDPQEPHTEDEVYFVVRGRGSFQAGDEEYDVEPGAVLFVEAGLPHRFHSIEEDLTILVVFAPPHGSQAPAGAS